MIVRHFGQELGTMYDLRLRFPFSWIVCGGSGSGKTTHVLNFLSQFYTLVANEPKCRNIIYYYNHWQPAFTEFEKQNIITHWVQGVPTLEDISERVNPFTEHGGSMVIIDDFAHMLPPTITELFTVVSHHANCGVILLSQNLFEKNPVFRQISLNSTYFSVFKNPRDGMQIAAFARQLNPTNWKFIIDSYKEATKKPHTYLFFDNHQKTCDELRIRSNILPHEAPMRIWVPKNP
jgi:hypothetical protein